ncbi:iron (metal) dependent repressor, DtxR family [Pyrolobus fumarii 1A]|uniref:Iron (Metal) dependent repressor, DtxR family n=1 Tax=Pyrolobus fumarii (strain DSM 11204 / 1A) TaxID=694429 RepID=G0EGE3_PYRF1|nr:metal-dependent transcriptional regulator [Pyrolobus fumarii]AEM39168.1 iron (metal) dependent repressor, DtxR family [Pyrolobus fumarii 1A]
MQQLKLNRREEEYLEAMLFLEKSKGKIRVKDLAERLGVKPPTVVEFLEKLAKKGLVDYKKHSGVSLTPLGRRVAEEVYKRHLAIKKFLMMLGVPEDIAERDACYIEHGISDESLRLITLFIEFVENCPGDLPRFLRHFRYYVEKRVWPPDCPHRREGRIEREDKVVSSACPSPVCLAAAPSPRNTKRPSGP